MGLIIPDLGSDLAVVFPMEEIHVLGYRLGQ